MIAGERTVCTFLLARATKLGGILREGRRSFGVEQGKCGRAAYRQLTDCFLHQTGCYVQQTTKSERNAAVLGWAAAVQYLEKDARMW